MSIEFTKMHGNGNDFVVIDATQGAVELTAQQVRSISDRQFGVGCDQLLLVEPASNEDAEFRYRIFNADGGEVEQCGNGARCFARFVIDQGLTTSSVIPVETAGGLIKLIARDDGAVTVDMGEPNFSPESLPFLADETSENHELVVNDEAYAISIVSMGNPHAVIDVDDVDTAPVSSLGSIIEKHQCFPNRVNVGFMQVVGRDEIRLRVFERGSGETLACGTGACAAVATGIVRGMLDAVVLVHLNGGDLVIEWQGPGNQLMMTGPAETVFKGRIEL